MAVFSLLNITLQICLNGQPVLTHEYIGENRAINRENGFNGFREKRHKHTDGEVTCVSTERYVSLPPMAVIGKSKNNSASAITIFLLHYNQNLLSNKNILELYFQFTSNF